MKRKLKNLSRTLAFASVLFSISTPVFATSNTDMARYTASQYLTDCSKVIQANEIGVVSDNTTFSRCVYFTLGVQNGIYLSTLANKPDRRKFNKQLNTISLNQIIRTTISEIKKRPQDQHLSAASFVGEAISKIYLPILNKYYATTEVKRYEK